MPSDLTAKRPRDYNQRLAPDVGSQRVALTKGISLLLTMVVAIVTVLGSLGAAGLYAAVQNAHLT